ncbi:ATP-binding protein [Roseomonas genomospecies 6]|uniref:Rad50/SbcC-type AAA domain-containing protein n=1 Tax=Roseomonas genomospecies 6 TaxID=214106 RepID=A0A9W7NJA1_9PROT|nr:ATP-binding protein [Roseomonas genomospecies 6]KAA0680353.1 hypothetical protein DS843_13650 [Roseomonas genomospecies 6]
MRIQELSAEWFRGAADTIALNTDNKSVVVYGPNGSGKSTFVDGLEYLLCSGKIAHLGHEYSGRRLENAIINTHCPAGASRRFIVKLDGGFEVVAELAANGAARFLGNDALEGWEKGWSILRQDEVSAFVHSSKGDKYSALLPLLGLEPIENVAANLRSISNRVKEEAGLERLRAQLTQLTQEWDAAFPGVATTSVGGLIKDLHRKYLPEQEVPPTLPETLAALRRSISERIAGLDAEGACHFHLKVAHEADLRSRLSEAVTASDHAAKLAEPLLEERLAVLRSAAMFGRKLADEGLIHCPACGREIDAGEFKEHVSLEATRLEGALKAFESRRLAFGRLASALVTAIGALSRKEVAIWRLAPEQAPVSKNLEALSSFDAERLREGVATPELERLRENLHPLAAHLEQSVKAVPPSVEQVVTDQRMVNAAASHATRRACASKITVVEGLLAFLGQVEAEVRSEIRQRTEVLIDSISTDLRRMWLILHPDEAVDEVRLYQPDGNKAIDIALRFHGKN